MQGADAILVPGGFGDRGVEGKILAAKYARENKMPFLGICLGMQIAVIEFARSLLGLKDANSEEFDPETSNPCVIFMPEVWNNFKLTGCWQLSNSFPVEGLFFCFLSRFQKLEWEPLCALGQGGHTLTLLTANLRNCKHMCLHI